MWRLEVRETVPRERDELGFRGTRARLQHHVGVGRLSPLLVRQADDRRLLYRGVAQQDPLDLQARDVLAAADDHVLDPITYLDVPIRVQYGRVAGVEPSVAHHLFGRFGVVVVPLHDHVAPGHDLAERLSVGRYVLPGVVDNTQLARGDQLDPGAGLDDPELSGVEILVLRPRFADRDERGGFGEAVDLRHLPSQITLHALDRRGGGCSSGGDHMHTFGHVAPNIGRSVGESNQDGRRGAQPPDLFLADQIEDAPRLHLRQAYVGASDCRDDP